MILGSITSHQAPAIIIILDFNGNVVKSFPVIDSTESTTIDYIFIVDSFIVLDDNSLIFWARTSYMSGAFGVSANSSIDFTFIKLNSVDRNLQWVTSIDFNSNFDQEISTYVFEGSLYFLLTSTATDYCLGNSGISDGKIQWNLCWKVSKALSIPQKLDIVFVTQKWIITSFPDSISLRNRNIIIFESGNLQNL